MDDFREWPYGSYETILSDQPTEIAKTAVIKWFSTPENYRLTMSNILLLTGPPGSGKSTIARKLAQHFPKSLHLQVDHIREMMVNGAVTPDQEWSDTHTQQFQWARTTAIYMAQLYAAQGVDVIIDDVSVPEIFEEQYAELFKNPGAKPILLLPTVEALIGRINKRGAPWDEELIKHVPWFYSYLDPMPKTNWIVLDTGGWTIEQTVSEVLAHIEGSSEAPAA